MDVNSIKNGNDMMQYCFKLVDDFGGGFINKHEAMNRLHLYTVYLLEMGKIKLDAIKKLLEENNIELITKKRI